MGGIIIISSIRVIMAVAKTARFEVASFSRVVVQLAASFTVSSFISLILCFRPPVFVSVNVFLFQIVINYPVKLIFLPYNMS